MSERIFKLALKKSATLFFVAVFIVSTGFNLSMPFTARAEDNAVDTSSVTAVEETSVDSIDTQKEETDTTEPEVLGETVVNEENTRNDNGHTPVTICHKDNDDNEITWETKVVDDDAVPAHLGHGDHEGACTGNEGDGDDECKDDKCDEPKTATVIATKIVCDSETDLPNWGNNGADITSTTAIEFIALNEENCHLEPWTFEWAPSVAINPGDNTSGATGGVWTPFNSSVVVPSGSLIWVREQVNSDYIPFSGATSNLDDVASKNSAEMYCSNDVLNYDNYDFINPVDAGQTYYCVGFNVLEEKEGQVCEETPKTYYSDLSTQVDGHDSVAVNPIHTQWTALIPDATWIWSENPIANAVNDTYKTFTKTFTIVGTPEDATLYIAADNSYDVSVNGDAFAADPTENNHSLATQDQYTIPASELVSGVNTISITVHNFAQAGGTMATNPAGLLFKIVVSEDCVNENVCEAGVNLVKNGNFEKDTVTDNGGTWQIFTSIIDWAVIGKAEIIDGYGGWLDSVNDVGTKFATLDTCCLGTIYQNIPTYSGNEYKVSFEHSAEPTKGATTNNIEFFWDGNSEGTFSDDGTSNPNTLWTTHTDTFVADGSSTQIKFTGLGIQDGAGNFVDNVVVECVPKDGPRCGDETKDEGEQCDDGNTENGDGCSAQCTIEVVEENVCEVGLELIKNGGFETPEVASGWSVFDQGTLGLDWLVDWLNPSGAPAIAKIEIQETGLNGWTAKAGDQWAELDSDWGYDNNESGATRIYQDIATELGATYEVKYSFGARPGVLANAIDVKVDGVSKDTKSDDGTGDTDITWLDDSFTFIGTGATQTISFENTDTSDSLGTFLDEVSVKCTDDSGDDDNDGGPSCGNNIVESGEACDAGPDGSSTCTTSCTVIDDGGNGDDNDGGSNGGGGGGGSSRRVSGGEVLGDAIAEPEVLGAALAATGTENISYLALSGLILAFLVATKRRKAII